MEEEKLLADADMTELTTNGEDDKTLAPMDCSTNGFTSESSKIDEAVKPWEVGEDRNIPCMYRQDVVRCNKDTSRTGIVTEVAGDPESDSDITDDDDDDDVDDDEDDGEDDENEAGNATDDETAIVDKDGDDGKKNENSDRGKENDYRKDPLPADQVRVMWLDSSETTHNLSDVTVIDRAFLHGDVVAAASDRTGQVGVVLDVSISVDLKSTDGSILKDVSSKDLKRVSDFTIGDYVVLGPWLGRVDEVIDDVTILFDDGSMCKVMKADPLRLQPISKSIMEEEHFPYYPGQRVKATSSSVFKNARWISGLWKASRLEGTVTKVTVGSVCIYWIASASGSGSTAAPAEEQSPKRLRLLSCLAHANWQVGDRCFFAPPPLSSSIPSNKNSPSGKSEDAIETASVSSKLECERGLEGVPLDNLDADCPSLLVDSMNLDPVPNLDLHTENIPESSCRTSMSVKKEHLHENCTAHRKKMRKVVLRNKKGRKKEDNFERALLIVSTKTKVDVVWQDGKTDLSLDSTSLIPIDNPGDQEFVPEQYVVEKASDGDDDVSEVRPVGVVRSVNAKERTARVRWLKQVARPEDPREFDKEEVVSVYGLEGHPDYDYCHGDVVVRLSPVSVSMLGNDSSDLVEELEQVSSDEDNCDPKANSGEEVEYSSKDETYEDFSDLSWVGNITGLKDGDIEVTWADGMVSTVGPQAIYVVGRDDDEESVGVGSEISDAPTWETVNEDEDEMVTLENAEEETGVQHTNNIIPEAETVVNSEDNNYARNGPFSIPLTAIALLSRLASGLFSRGRRTTDSTDPSYKECQSPGTVDASERRASSAESSSLSCAGENAEDDGHESDATDTAMVIEDLSTFRSDEADASSLMLPCSFKHFDIATDPLDHFFLGGIGQFNNGRKWLKKVQQDWSILTKNLPDTIYVRVYEDRMDLLRAVIVGAYGTPYQDGLFFFDFHLPPEYPQVPLSAHYHSGGWRINPNLYEEGKVCLSLLNTWTGRGNEVWDPSSSSILQVLVSLQGLVLNSKPYFNEAGYDKQVGTAEGEKNSLSYNENTFLLNCKSMMYLMRRPPKDFEEFVKDHFRRRGYFILKACDAYMNGFSIGSLTEDASLSDKSNETSTSVGFKLMLAKIMPKLIAALNEVGADVHQFKHLEQL